MSPEGRSKKRAAPPARRRAPPCPICGKPASEASLVPFCSPRCKMVDLGRWFGERYRIPGEPPAGTEKGGAESNPERDADEPA